MYKYKKSSFIKWMKIIEMACYEHIIFVFFSFKKKIDHF